MRYPSVCWAIDNDDDVRRRNAMRCLTIMLRHSVAHRVVRLLCQIVSFSYLLIKLAAEKLQATPHAPIQIQPRKREGVNLNERRGIAKIWHNKFARRRKRDKGVRTGFLMDFAGNIIFCMSWHCSFISEYLCNAFTYLFIYQLSVMNAINSINILINFPPNKTRKTYRIFFIFSQIIS